MRTLFDRCDNIVTCYTEKQKETQVISSSLVACGYPKWSLKRRKARSPDRQGVQQPGVEPTSRCVTLPYCAGLSEKLTRIFRKHDTRVGLKPEQTVKGILVKPKDRTPQDQQCGAIYKITCAECDAFYIGESGRQLNTRIGEHKKSVRLDGISSAVGEHQMDTGHDIKWEEVSVLAVESKDFARKVKEAIEIHSQQPKLNRPALYDRVLRTRHLDTQKQ